MKLKISEIKDKISLVINGFEDWLQEIYNMFPGPNDKEKPRLTGFISIDKSSVGDIQLSGNIKYIPFVRCSRCNDFIEWPLNLPIDICFKIKPEEEPFKKVRELTKDDLEEYFYNGDSLDLDIFINEIIQLSIPNQFLRLNKDGKCCEICGEDLSKNQVYQGEEIKTVSPFEILQKLK